jgi:hypothetical protein
MSAAAVITNAACKKNDSARVERRRGDRIVPNLDANRLPRKRTIWQEEFEAKCVDDQQAGEKPPMSI